MVKIGPTRYPGAPTTDPLLGEQKREPDMSLLSELYEEIERNPRAIEARKLLIEQYVSTGWTDAARDAAQELLKLKPRNAEIKRLVQSLKEDAKEQKPASKPGENHFPAPSEAIRSSVPQLPEDREKGKQQLLQGYQALMEQAKALLRESTMLRDLSSHQNTGASTSIDASSKRGFFSSFFATNKREDASPAQKEDFISPRFEKHIPDLVAIADGRISTVVGVKQTGSVRSVARSMEARSHEAVDIAFKDLEETARWLSSAASSKSPLDSDGVRESLVKRVRTLEAALSDNLKPHAFTALMHVEHEVLRKKYIGGDTTMLGDPISEIERASFYVTEDGYPWDVSELAQAISSNGGVMRNPLSRQMFTIKDINAVVQHPLGRHLAALDIEQKKLKLGSCPFLSQ